MAPYEIENCKKDNFVFDCDNCIINALDFLLKFKREEHRIINKTVAHNLQLHAQNGSSFDNWNNLNNLPRDKHIVDIIKNGKANIKLKVFNGYK